MGRNKFSNATGGTNAGVYYYDDGTPYILNDPSQPDDDTNEVPITIVDSTGNYYEDADTTTLYDQDGNVINNNYSPGGATTTAAPASTPWYSSVLNGVGNFLSGQLKSSVTPETGTPTTAPIVSTGSNTLTLILVVLSLAGVGGAVYYIMTKDKVKT